MDSGRGRGGYHGGYHGGGGGGRFRNRRGGRGGRNRHHPYNNRSRGPRSGRGNRFTSSQDQQSNMLRQVYSFVSRVGELKNIKDSESPEMRAVEATTATNINDLTAVLCSQEKLPMLLRYQKKQGVSNNGDGVVTYERPPPQGNTEFEVGKLVHLLISCVAGLPLQTPCYAALTLAVHEEVKGGEWEGFAGRCVTYAMRHIARDLDMILLQGTNQAHGACRLKLMLRYLAILGRIGVVQSHDPDQADATNMTVMGLLSLLVEAASAAADQHSNMYAATILAMLVLSTLPYIMEYAPPDFINEKILQPIETILGSYKSSFTPGTGNSSVLLKEEQLEDDEDDDEEEEDDDDDDDEGGQVCDTLQDLLRIAKLVKDREGTSRFALPVDAPWKGLTKSSKSTEESDASDPQPVVYQEAPMYLKFSHECAALSLLIRGEGNWKLQCFNLDGVVFGRLPIFGSPPEPGEADEDMDEELAKNEGLQAYVKGFSLLDRYFVSESLRDCIISHESSVAPTGLLRGNARHVAEELLSIRYMLSGWDPSGPDGVEYAILETVFALLTQSTETSSLRHASLSRILLELTRLQPARMSPALIVAMSKLFQDYFPSLVPTARENISRWLSYHLINTDYQWPSAYWKLWEPYAVAEKTTSRGTFVKRTLNLMVENVSDPKILVTQCLPSESALSDHLFETCTTPFVALPEDSSMDSLSQDIGRRFWEENEDADTLLSYLVSEEVSESVADVLDKSSDDLNQVWWRTSLVARMVGQPAIAEYDRMTSSIQRARQPDEDLMDDEEVDCKDVFAVVTDAIGRCHQLLSGVLAKDADDLKQRGDGGKSEEELALTGEAYLLQQIESLACYSRSLMGGLVECLVRHKVISGVGVLRWALGGLSTGTKPSVVPRWWEVASTASRASLVSALESSKGNSDDAFGMMIDRGGGQADESGSSQSKADASLSALCPLLQYAVSQVCSMLATDDAMNQKKMLPEDVDLVEGVKALVTGCYALLASTLQQPGATGMGSLPNEIQQIILDSEASGVKLASICEGYEGIVAVNILKRSLENII